MMEVTSAASQPDKPLPTSEPAKKPAIRSDFETFLKMLTTQMQNQDPLDPTDASDFAVQLATFSTVEQQVLTNDLLTSLGDHLATQNMGQLQGWIGRTARAEMPVAFDGTPVPLTLPASADADRAQLVVTDRGGNIVDRQAVPPSGGAFQWMGQDRAGHLLPSGLYQLEIQSFKGDASLKVQALESEARIAEVRLGTTATGPTLIMAGGQEVPASKVLGLRAPDG